MPSFTKTADQRLAIDLLGSMARYVLLFGGSRSGKTFILIYALLVRALKAPGSRHVILRSHFNAVKQSVFMDTLPKVIDLAFHGLDYRENRSDWLITLPNKSEIWIGGLDDNERADKILGKEFATIYFNEASEIGFHAVSTALSRLAQKTSIVNKAYFDCNPAGKSHWSYKLFVEKIDPVTRAPVARPELYASMLMNPQGNAGNIADGYIEQVLGSLTERQKQRFLEGRWLEDRDDALWKRALIDNFRIANVPELSRIVIGVDPAVTTGKNSDNTGIVVAGVSAAGHYYVLNDASLNSSPLEWALAVEREYSRWRADRVIGEINNGGDLIEMNLRNVSRNISFKSVRASRGKIARAEPVAALYEQGKVHHVGIFSELEDEMCNYSPAFANSSPDRLDALVWALVELSSRTSGDRLISA